VVVNDLDVALDGSRTEGSVAAEVVDEIERSGGRAVANGDDVSDWEAAAHLVAAALDSFGRLDGVVNNAGIVRDRMFANATPDEWDAVMRVHLRGHFCVSRHAASHWRELAKEHGPVGARIVNTTSGAGLLGSVGQSAYSAAKAGIAGLTLVQAAELRRYGVTVNAVAPSARTRMTESVFAEAMAPPGEPSAFDAMAPENVSPLVAWLCSSESRSVNGRIFEVEGGRITVMDGWQRAASYDEGRRLDARSLEPVVGRLIEESPVPLPVYGS